MSHLPDTSDEGSEHSAHYIVGERPQRYVFDQSNHGNGNGANRIVWAVAGVLSLVFIGLLTFIVNASWESNGRLTRLETQVEIILQRLPP